MLSAPEKPLFYAMWYSTVRYLTVPYGVLPYLLSLDPAAKIVLSIETR